jgi:hypothetical protein
MMKKEKKQTPTKKEETKNISVKEFDSIMKKILSAPPVEVKKKKIK